MFNAQAFLAICKQVKIDHFVDDVAGALRFCKISGNSVSATNGICYYKITDTDIDEYEENDDWEPEESEILRQFADGDFFDPTHLLAQSITFNSCSWDEILNYLNQVSDPPEKTKMAFEICEEVLEKPKEKQDNEVFLSLDNLERLVQVLKAAEIKFVKLRVPGPENNGRYRATIVQGWRDGCSLYGMIMPVEVKNQ